MKHRPLAVLLLIFGTLALLAAPSSAHDVCSEGWASADRDGRTIIINGYVRNHVCGYPTLDTSVDDSWYECWPVHRHHWGATWWWHSHPSSSGARNTGRVHDVSWGNDSYIMPDDRGVKTACQFDGYHDNWDTFYVESSTV